MTTVTSPARRVLATKSTNTFLPASPHDVPNKLAEMAAARSRRSTVAVTSSPPTYPVSKLGPRAGQKRRREEREETRPESQPEPQSESQESIPDSAPSTQVLDDSAFEGDVEDSAAGSSMLQSRSVATPSTLLSSFHVSHVYPIEETFDIQEEVVSQQTLENIHAVKFSQPISQLVPPLRPTLATETSQDSMGMSSFIDFDESRGGSDDDLTMIPLSPRHSDSKPQTNKSESDGKPDFAEKAQTLRTRLQLALYKVQTNQASRPFSRLQKPRAASPDLPDLPATLTPSLVARQFSSSLTPTLRGGAGEMSPESRIAIARARSIGMNALKPRIANLGSLAVPVLKPGAFSARFASGDGEREPKTPRREGTEELGDMGSGTARREGRGPFGEMEGLTSSVVKGEAANGLLELRRAAGAVGGS